MLYSVIQAGREWRAPQRGRGAIALLALAVSCKADAPAPDSQAAEGHDLKIELFKHAPFVDGDTENAPLVAVQDGDAAWTAVAGERGVYQVHLASHRHGVAIGCPAGGGSLVRLFQRTAADGVALRTRSCGTTPIDLEVAVRNVPDGSIAYISTSGGSAGGGNLTYAFRVQPGPAELFASLNDRTGRSVKLLRVPTFLLETRQTITIDFASQGTAPDTRAFEVAAAVGEPARVTSSVIRPTGEYALHPPVVVNLPATYQTLPVALRQSDDLFAVTVAIGARSTTMTSRAPGDLAFELPRDINAQTPSVLATPFLHPVFSFATSTTDLAIQTYLLSAHTSDEADLVSCDWSAELSASWIAGAPSVQYTFPDLSAVAGFSPELLLFDRGPIRWSVRRTETSSAGDVDGRVLRSALQSGAIESYCGDHSIEPPETCDPPDGTTCSPSCTKL